jgi:ethanolamine ammonia-lyase large subunit
MTGKSVRYDNGYLAARMNFAQTIGTVRYTLDIAAVAPGFTPVMVAAVSKIMRVQAQFLAAVKIGMVTRFRTSLGLPGGQ